MIQEDYVSFETAKLLKEKGFDIPCRFNYRSMYPNTPKPFYHKSSKDFNSEEYKGLRSEWFSAPTQQMAVRWLREMHNLSIAPYRTACGYLYTIDRIPTGSTIFSAQYEGDDEDSGQFTTWELAVENAIKYCLENLI